MTDNDTDTGTGTALTLTVERVIDATPEALFDAWLDPETMKRFLGPEDITVPDATTDPHKGGRFEVTLRSDGQDRLHAGTYTLIDRPSRLAFTWESQSSHPETEITLSFAPGPAGTRVTLTQIHFLDKDQRDSHGKAWTSILRKLAAIE